MENIREKARCTRLSIEERTRRTRQDNFGSSNFPRLGNEPVFCWSYEGKESHARYALRSLGTKM